MNITTYTQHRMRLFKKTFVSALCFCLAAQPLIFAAPAQFTDALIIPYKLVIPPSSGNVSGQFSGSPENPHMILVRDAHTNASAQLHISEILDSMMLNRGITTVFVEAGSGNLSLNELNQFGTPEQRKPVAMQFLKKGILQGSEYLQLTSDYSFDLFGVEDESLYDRSLDVFKQSVKFRTSFADKYTQAKALALKLADKILDPRLRDLIRLQERYRKSEIGPMQYMYRIYDWMQMLDGSSGNYEAVSGLLDMKVYEEQIDFKSAAQILYQLRDSDSEWHSFADELISCLETDNHQMLTQFLNSTGADVKLRQLGSVPGLKTYAEYLNHLKNIDFNSVWSAKEKLERAYARELTSSETERRLYLAVQRLEIFRKLSEQQLTPDEAYYIENAPLRWRQITGFLNTVAAEYNEIPESALLYDPDEDRWIQSFEDFYNLTLKRDEAFLQNVKEYLNRSGQKEAVLIAGGYHTENLKQMLQKMSWSYSVVLPKVDHETDLSRYERLLTGQDSGSENTADDTRVQNQDTMMLRQVLSNRGPLKFAVLKQAIQKVAGSPEFSDFRNNRSEFLRTQPVVNAGSRLALSERQPKIMRLTNNRIREEVLVREYDAAIRFGNLESERTNSSFQFEITYDSEQRKHFFRLSAFGGMIRTENIEFPNVPVIVKARAGKRLNVKEEGFFRRNVADSQYIASRDIDFIVKKVSGTDFQFSIQNRLTDGVESPFDEEETHLVISGIESQLFDEFIHYDRLVGLLSRVIQAGLSDQQVISAIDNLSRELPEEYLPMIPLALNHPFSHVDEIITDEMSLEELANYAVQARDSDETIQDLETLFYRMTRYVRSVYEGGWNRQINPNLAMFPILVGLIHQSPRLRATAMDFFSSYQVNSRQRDSLIKILEHELRSPNSPDYVRQAAIRALQHFEGDNVVIQALEQELRYDPNSQNEDLVPTPFLLSALRSLVVNADPGGVLIAAAFIGSDNIQVHELALEVYTEIADTSIESNTLRRSRNRDDRLTAIHALLTRRSSRLRDEAVVYALSDPDSEVAERAIDAISTDPSFPIEPLVQSIRRPILRVDDINLRNPGEQLTSAAVIQNSRLRAIQAFGLKGVGEELAPDLLALIDVQAADWGPGDEDRIEEALTSQYPLGSDEELELIHVFIIANRIVSQNIRYGMTDLTVAQFRLANDFLTVLNESLQGQLPNLDALLDSSGPLGSRLSMENQNAENPLLEDVQAQFFIPQIALQQLTQNALDEMHKGLKEGGSSLKMIGSTVRKPTGKETGEVLSYDFGGTNARALKVRLNGNGILNDEDIQLNEKNIPESLKTSTVEELYDFIAGQIEDLGLDPEQTYHLGFSFAFPVDENGNLIRWVKEFDIPELVGKSVTQPLYEALARRGITNITLVGPVNDTVSTLAASSYGNAAASLGVIAGTGHNIAAWVDGAAVNFESGAFDVFLTPSMNTETDIDRTIDANSENTGINRFEKMMSGKYFGEIVRLNLKQLASEGKIFGGVFPEGLSDLWSLETADASVVFAGDQTDGLKKIREYLAEKGAVNVTLQDAVLVRDLTVLLAERSARLLAAMISAGIYLNDPLVQEEHFVAIDGSLYEKFPSYRIYLDRALVDILGTSKAKKIKIFLQADASGIGAALIAASAMNDVPSESDDAGARLADKSLDGYFKDTIQEAIDAYNNALLVRLALTFTGPVSLLQSNAVITAESAREIFEPFEPLIFDAVSEVRSLRERMAILEDNEDDFMSLRAIDSPDCGICHGISTSLSYVIKSFGMDAERVVVDSGPDFVTHSYVRWGSLAVDVAAGQFDESFVRKIIIQDSVDEHDAWIRGKIVESKERLRETLSLQEIESIRDEYADLRVRALRAIRDSYQKPEGSRLSQADVMMMDSARKRTLINFAAKIAAFKKGDGQIRIETLPYQTQVAEFTYSENGGQVIAAGILLGDAGTLDDAQTPLPADIIASSEWLDLQTKIRSASSTRISLPREFRLPQRPYLAVLDLASVVGNDALTPKRIQALASALSVMNRQRKVLLTGPEALQRELIRSVISGPVLYNSESQLSREESALPRVYLMGRSALEQSPAQNDHVRFVAIEDISGNEAESTVHVYQPIIRWLDALGSFDEGRSDAVSREALVRFYRTLSGMEFTENDFLKVLQGDRETSLRFTIPAISRVALNLAVRAYQLILRTSGISA